jgi:iron complex transport system substrate-binding protein
MRTFVIRFGNIWFCACRLGLWVLLWGVVCLWPFGDVAGAAPGLAGRAGTSAGPIRRIVSLAPSLTSNIQYLGAEDLLAGCTSYCQTSRPVPVVASAVKVNVEMVVSRKPDLVVATDITDPEVIAMLKKCGLRVEVYPTARSFAEVCTQFEALGTLIGRQDQGRKALSKVREQVARIRASLPAGQKPSLFFQIGANPLFTVLPGTYMDDLITFAGARNIASGMTSGTVTREFVLLRNPDVIFVVTMGMVGAQEKQEWERLTRLKAALNRKIFVVSSEQACTPSPVPFVETLRTMVGLMYGNDVLPE